MMAEGVFAYRAPVRAALTGYIDAPGIPAGLRETMAYSLAGGGKLLRACLVLSACAMLGGDTRTALPVACGLEMIHTYSLIHDDLPAMDDDDYRRGRPANHKVFGDGRAILAGDGLLSYAFEIMLEGLCAHPGLPGYADALRAVARGAGVRGMVAGQAADLACEAGGDVAEYGATEAERLQYIHTRKTGAMITAALLAGAHLAGAGAADIAELDGFGAQYGLLFQITDDILDAEGDPACVGKTLGKDDRHDKLTYVTLYGLADAKARADATLTAALAALACFGEAAEPLRALARDTRLRDR